MPLPTDPRQPIIPERLEGIYDKLQEWSALYSSDPNQLASYYSSKVYNGTPQGRFWSRVEQAERSTMLHVPIAKDISTASADLLFSEKPKVTFQTPSTQERFDEISVGINFWSRILEAAETCSALGGVYIKVNWDKALTPYPILSVAQADMAIPEFRFGFLQAVTFWTVLEEEKGIVWRLLERHEKGAIITGLYKGTPTEIGKAVPLTYRAETAHLVPVITTGIDDILVRYVPNMKPNNLFRGSDLGKSDYAGLEGLMDGLDEIYTSLLRDVKLGKGRIIVPETMVDQHGKFSLDKEVFTVIPVGVTDLDSLPKLVDCNQFDIRSDQHIKAALEIMDRIISGAGYSPQTFGLKIDGRAESGTALNIRERKSFVTSAKKATYWKAALEQIIELMLIVDRQMLGTSINPERPTVEIQDSVQHDINQVAQSIMLIKDAGAASTRTLVKTLHPDWTDDQVELEVQEILKEKYPTL